MKVLFAVSDETISQNIIKQYQEDYKEIITSTNKYFFNAIIKELAKDKTYDAIVISEDLEPVANNNYDQIDKFILEKLDDISDEASKLNGEDIPIIFICSDRRTRNDELLRNLFSMGIYNALVEKDRNIPEVCRLLDRPRVKKEAKKYYLLDGEDTTYNGGSNALVSEDQINNILNYYSQLGGAVDKYSETFDHIAQQYDDSQLRLIIKFLPENVKIVLEKNNAKYQQLVNKGTVLSDGSYSAYPKKQESDLGSIYQQDLKSQKLSNPVVIPEAMNFQAVHRQPIRPNTQTTMGQRRPITPINQQTSQNLGAQRPQQPMQNSRPAQNGQPIRPMQPGQNGQPVRPMQPGQNNHPMRPNPNGQNPYGNQMGNQYRANGSQQAQRPQPTQNRQPVRPQQPMQNPFDMGGPAPMQNPFDMGSTEQINNPFFNQAKEDTQNPFDLGSDEQTTIETVNPFDLGSADQSMEQKSVENSSEEEKDLNIDFSSIEVSDITEDTKIEKTEVPNIETISQIEEPVDEIDNQLENIDINEDSIVTKSNDEEIDEKNEIEETLDRFFDANVENKVEEPKEVKKESEEVETVKEIVEGEPEAVEEIVEEKPEAVEEIVEEEPEAVEEIVEEEPETVEEIVEEEPETIEEIVEERPEAVKEVVEEEPEINAEELINETTFDFFDNSEEMISDKKSIETDKNANNQNVNNKNENINENINSNVNQMDIAMIDSMMDPMNMPMVDPMMNQMNMPMIDPMMNSMNMPMVDPMMNQMDMSMVDPMMNQMNMPMINSMNMPMGYPMIDPMDMQSFQNFNMNDYQPNEVNGPHINGFEQFQGEIQPIDYSDDYTISSMSSSMQSQEQDLSTISNVSRDVAGNGKVVAFIGTSKNGTSFLADSVGMMLSQAGIKTAIVDTTKNKNSYYMFTNSNAKLGNIAASSMKKLAKGEVAGLSLNPSLTVFTGLPGDVDELYLDVDTIIDTLSMNFDVVLLDCDFSTDDKYFAKAKEYYLVQTMDAFTIQPLTRFLSELKLKGLLDENKLRIVINKYIKMKKLSYRMIIGGLSKYNEPAMTLQRDLFNPNNIPYILIPFDDETYEAYLQEVAMCDFKLNNYSDNFLNALEKLKNMIVSEEENKEKEKKGRFNKKTKNDNKTNYDKEVLQGTKNTNTSSN